MGTSWRCGWHAELCLYGTVWTQESLCEWLQDLQALAPPSLPSPDGTLRPELEVVIWQACQCEGAGLWTVPRTCHRQAWEAKDWLAWAATPSTVTLLPMLA